MEQLIELRGLLGHLEDTLRVAIDAFLSQDDANFEYSMITIRDCADQLLPEAKRLKR